MKRDISLLRIAVQKSGRLGEESLNLLQHAGFSFSFGSRTLLAKSKDFPMEILFLRVSDIPEMVANGTADLGIVGENTLAQNPDTRIITIENLGFGKCSICLAVPENSKIHSISDLSGRRIATSYSRILRQYLEEKKVSAEIIPMSGSVEIAPSLDIAEAIFDIVSTGSTLAEHRLKKLESVFPSQAVLIAPPEPIHAKNSQKTEIITSFLFRIRSVLNAKKLKSIIMNAPKSSLAKIIDILPGLKSPTITPLATAEMMSIHAVVEEDIHFWHRLEALKEAGASGILVMPVERVIF